MNSNDSNDHSSFWYVIGNSNQNEVGTNHKKIKDPIKV